MELPAIRKNAASGGMVTALLCDMLRSGKINGAWVTKTVIDNGRLEYKTFIATTEEEIMSCSSSIYMYMPLMKHLNVVREFNGKVAVVLLPCQLKALNNILERDNELREKIVIKLGLFCSGSHDKEDTLLSIKKAGLSLNNAKKLYYRRGMWRGTSTIIYKNGQENNFS